jgi:tRNA pseudouridine13 synthase
MGEIEREIIDEEKIDYRDLIIPDIPYISSKGSRRAILAQFRNLNYYFKKDDLGNDFVNIKFELTKGCYATSLLREFMKAENIRDY